MIGDQRPPERPGVGADGPPSDVDAATAHQVLRIISMGLAATVAIFGVVALVLNRTGVFPPFLGYPTSVRVGIAVFLVFLLGISYPLYGWAGGAEPPKTPEEALSRLQIRVMVANATRDAAGIMGCLLILLTGDLWLGATVAALAVVTILLSVPSRDDVESAIRRVSRR